MFPTSDEDSSTPDTALKALYQRVDELFPTSDEDSSTPDSERKLSMRKLFLVSDL